MRKQPHSPVAFVRSVASTTLIALALSGAPLAASIAGCGAAPTPIVVTPMTDAERLVFENGVDYIDDPSILEGTWSESWDQEIDLRSRTADIVAFIRVVTLRTDSDLEHRQTQRIIGQIDSLRFGTHRGDEIELVARDTDPGFSTIQGDRILNQRFVLFGRWTQESESAPLLMRWHLAPASERVVRRVNTLVERRAPSASDRRRVIVRDQPAD